MLNLTCVRQLTRTGGEAPGGKEVMMQTLDQVVRVAVLNGALARSVEENVAIARRQRSMALSGEFGGRSSKQILRNSSTVADAVIQQLGLRAGVVMTEEFDSLMDGYSDEVFPFLEAVLASAGSALAP